MAHRVTQQHAARSAAEIEMLKVLWKAALVNEGLHRRGCLLHKTRK
jgi:hypothetical protein